jgi:hypothetical protein
LIASRMEKHTYNLNVDLSVIGKGFQESLWENGVIYN